MVSSIRIDISSFTARFLFEKLKTTIKAIAKILLEKFLLLSQYLVTC